MRCDWIDHLCFHWLGVSNQRYETTKSWIDYALYEFSVHPHQVTEKGFQRAAFAMAQKPNYVQLYKERIHVSQMDLLDRESDFVFAIQHFHRKDVVCRIVLEDPLYKERDQIIHEMVVRPDQVHWLLEGAPLFTIPNMVRFQRLRLECLDADTRDPIFIEIEVYKGLLDSKPRETLLMSLLTVCELPHERMLSYCRGGKVVLDVEKKETLGATSRFAFLRRGFV